MVTDPISDMLAQLQNAGKVHKSSITLPYSKLRHAVATALVDAGFVASVSKRGKKAVKPQMEIGLVYDVKGLHRISGALRLSKPSRRVYIGAKDIKPVRHGYGKIFLSSPKGIMTGDEAKKAKVGGEALFKIW